MTSPNVSVPQQHTNVCQIPLLSKNKREYIMYNQDHYKIQDKVNTMVFNVQA